MSQFEIYKIILELGGKATTKQIRQRAEEKFPNYTLKNYVYDRLQKLHKKELVKKNNRSEWRYGLGNHFRLVVANIFPFTFCDAPISLFFLDYLLSNPCH